MRFRLRTLVIVLVVGPPLLAVAWLWGLAFVSIFLLFALYLGLWFVLGLAVGALVRAARRWVAGSKDSGQSPIPASASAPAGPFL